MRPLPAVLAAGIVCGLSGFASGDVAELSASKDNTLYASAVGNLSNGAGEFFFAGNTGQSVGERGRRGLIYFDIAAAIPAGSTINSVTLDLYCSRAALPSSEPVGLHVCSQDWGESTSDAPANEGGGATAAIGDATWFHTFHADSFWTTAGGDYVAGASATQSVASEGPYVWSSTAQLVADVQAWLDAPASNYGWVVVGSEVFSTTAKRFNTREFTGPSSQRPKLTIDFTPLGGAGACCLPDGSCIAVSSESECTGAGGTYQGIGTDCGSVTCPEPDGACCLNDGTCIETTEALCLGASGDFQGDFTTCEPDTCPMYLEPFVDALPIPAIAQPVTGVPGGVAEYDIAIREVYQTVHRDLPATTIWGYDDGNGASWPGPTILASRDNPVTVNWLNDLRYVSGPNIGMLREEHFLVVDQCMHGPDHHGPTARVVTHLHGGHIPAGVDGHPEKTWLPGESEQYVYPNNQPGATIWYHDHALGITRLNVQMGLAGAYVLQDADDLAVNLPSGAYDVPLIIQDRSFDESGSITYPDVWQDHYYGDFAIVNGKVQPFLYVHQGKYRFRVLDGCNTRALTLSLSNGLPFVVVAGDGGMLDGPSAPVTEFTISPGERVEVIVDFESVAPGTEIILNNSAMPMMAGAAELPELMKFVVLGAPGHTDAIPATLRTNEVLLESDAIMTRDFEIKKDPKSTPACSATWWLINGLMWDDIVEFPELGTTEIWRFNNPSGMMHPMHMHLVLFQVLDHSPLTFDKEGNMTIGPPSPPTVTEQGWQDTVQVHPGMSTRVIARFEDYVGAYAYHCHILEHEDHEMMRQFQSVLACPADSDRDGEVDTQDLLELLGTWGSCLEPCSSIGEINDVDTCPADGDRDCVVGVKDLLRLLGSWGPCASK